MSEQMQEPETPTPEPTEEPVSLPEPEEPNPDAEPAEPIEGADEDAGEPSEPAGGDEDEGAAGEAAAPPSGSAQDEKAIEIRYGKLANENARHARRVSEIMEEDATSLIQCPVCMDGIAGWIYPPDVAPLPDVAVARIRQVIGLPAYSNFKAATFAQECPDCGGLGEVRTGSHLPGKEVTTCRRCGKAGWIDLGTQPQNGHAPIAEVTPLTGPTVYGGEEPDDEVRNLRERGFTVIPP